MRDGEIDKVIGKISALPEADKLTLENKAEVETAREAYNELTEEQQKLVTNLNKLETAEAKIKELTELKVLRVKDIEKELGILKEEKIEIVAQENPSIKNFGFLLYLTDLQEFFASNVAKKYEGIEKFEGANKETVLIMTLEDRIQFEIGYDNEAEGYFKLIQGNYTIEQLENAVLTVKQNK